MALVKPVVARDWFYEGFYYIFTYLGYGRWARWTLQWIAGATTAGRLSFHISDVYIGEVHPAKWQDFTRKSGSNGISNVGPVNGWVLAQANQVGEWIEWDLPPGHDRVHVIIWARNISGIWNITNGASGTEGYDVTSIDSADAGLKNPNGISEEVVATNMTGTGNKLRLTCASVETAGCYVVGIHSFNTNTIGDPATIYTAGEGGDDLAMGFDLVDIIGDNSDWYMNHEALLANTPMIMSKNTAEFTVSWRPHNHADGLMWTAYSPAHYGGGEANWVTTSNPTLWVNGVCIGDMTDLIDVPLGTLFTDGRISMTVSGFGNYDQDDVPHSQDAEDLLEATVIQDWTSAGLGLSVLVHWTGDCDVSKCYVPSIPMVDSSAILMFPPDPTETQVQLGSGTYKEETNIASVRFPEFNVKIESTASGPTFSVEDQSASSKMLYKMDLAALPGGVNPNEKYWMLGGTISIQEYFEVVPISDVVSAEYVVVGQDNYVDGDAGTFVVPTESQVLFDVDYGTGEEFTGTVTLPSITDVEQNVEYGVGGIEFAGTFIAPLETKVVNGINYGNAAEFTGNFVCPVEAAVLSGVQYGANGVEFTGNRITPSTADVQEGVSFGPGGASTGRFGWPEENEVMVGVGYGASDIEFIGTHAAVFANIRLDDLNISLEDS